MEIKLEPKDYEICKLIGDLRDIINKQIKAKDRRGSKVKNISYYGMLGEYAFAKCFNYFPDLTLEKPANRDIDFITPEGKVVDVKTGMNETECLNINAPKLDNGNHADYYVSFHVEFKKKVRCPDTMTTKVIDIDPPKIKYVGWLPGKEIKERGALCVQPDPGRSYYQVPYCLLRKSTPKYIFGDPTQWNKK